MTDKIFDDYPASESGGGSRASNGGQQAVKELPYSHPVGPTGMHHEGPGLHGDNCGNCGTQHKG